MPGQTHIPESPSSPSLPNRSSIPPPSVAPPADHHDDQDERRGDPPIDGEPSPAPSPSFVHPDETTVRFAPPCPSDPVNGDTAELHQTFRHSFWALRRSRVAMALGRLGFGNETQQRFASCGSSAWVLRDREQPDHYRLATNRCRNRWCEACTRDRRRIVSSNLQAALEGHELRLLTLTLAARPDPLADQLDRLCDSFRTFRRRRDVSNRMTGGVFFLELTFNERTDRWHPHLHVIFEGAYLPYAIAKNAWFDITGDSYIIDLRSLSGARGAAGYVTKYATKSVNASVWTAPARLDEAMTALTGRRTFQPFGAWRALHLSKPPEDDTMWEPVCTLADLIRRAQVRDQSARRILLGLVNHNDLDALDLPQPLGYAS